MNERDELRTADLADQRREDRAPEPVPAAEPPSEADGWVRDDHRPEAAAPRTQVAPDDRPEAVPPRTEMAPDDRPEAVPPRTQMAPDADGADVSSAGPLLAGDDAEAFRARWTDVQNGFVDAPRQAVEEADGLTAELMQHLARTFADERARLEGQWDRGDDVSTDSLRTAFQRYRSFFERLLAT